MPPRTARESSPSKQVLFLTNNSSKSRLQYVEKLASNGIRAAKNEVFTSSSVAAWYLDSLPSFDKARQRPFVVGGRGIVLEMEELGIRAVHADALYPGGAHLPVEELARLEPEADVGAVVVGIDWHFNYTKCAHAARVLARGGPFVATNRDSTYPTAGGLLPGGGSCVAMVENAAGRVAVDTGKPRRHMFELAREAHGLDPARCLMVGDRHNTDIMLGRSNGLDTLLVMTGVTPRDQVPALAGDPATAPHFVASSVAELA